MAPPADDPSADVTLLADLSSTGEAICVGATFAGRYRIERELGRGAMGAVYAAFDDAVGERVAVKVLTLLRADAVERFRREVRLARKVTHRNAARTFDLGEHEGVRYITMELVHGQSLAARLERESRLPPGAAVEIATQIADGLQAAHDVGVVHRDLKPANVLLEPSGRAVITDFGVARAIADEAATHDGAGLVGTPAYMAPEQVEGARVDERTDVYALGLMLYELLTGTRPFRADTAIGVAVARLQRAPDDPRTHAAIPAALADVVMHCLQRDPSARPATAADVARALRSLELGPDATVAGATPPPRHPATADGSVFAPTSPGTLALAVLPFRYRGPRDEDYLAESLTDELVDLLSMTRGLRVSGSGATSRYADERDPRRIGRELEVDAVVDGTVQRARDVVRISVRLLDAEDGVQRWSDRVEGPLEDVFDLQDRIAKRVAESLRVQLTQRQAQRVPADVAELYLRARQLVGETDSTGGMLQDAIDLLDECLQRVPDFAPALALRAQACVQRWFLPSALASEEDWAARSQAAVDAALVGAPHLAETQLAAARDRVSRGKFVEAARHLSTALAIAPTYAAAHEYLGFLQCEAGRSDEGIRHILLARELDPSLPGNVLSVLRAFALAGDTERYEATLAEARAQGRLPQFSLNFIEMRVAAWHGDLERIRAMGPRLEAFEPLAPVQLAKMMRKSILGELSPAEAQEQGNAIIERIESPRFRAAIYQGAAEVFALRGEVERALDCMRRADADGLLIDADWFDRCPALGPLRDHPDFRTLSTEVRRRADAIWRIARDR